jgi:hypothetical protein
MTFYDLPDYISCLDLCATEGCAKLQFLARGDEYVHPAYALLEIGIFRLIAVAGKRSMEEDRQLTT